MGIKGKAYVVGAYEHPARKAEEKSVAQLHAEVAKGALEDAGLSTQDVDGYFCAGDAPGLGALSMIDYMGLAVRHVDTTETGGSSYLVHVAHAAQAIAAGKCAIALVTLAGRPRSEGSRGTQPRNYGAALPDAPYEAPYGPLTVNLYAMAAMRHMHEYGTTSEQLAWIKVAASHHAQYNRNAMLREIVTVQDVLESPLIADPLHRLDCCVVSDGGGALIVAAPEIARSLARPRVRVLGAGEAPRGLSGGRVDMTVTGAVSSGKTAFEEAGVTPADIKYASIYDSFTITVLLQLEDLGFCPKGEGAEFVRRNTFTVGGTLPLNTSGGQLSVGQAGAAGGYLGLTEAIRQLTGRALGAQVEGARLGLVSGFGMINYDRGLCGGAAILGAA
jgi:acetyl-CoA C-acetyltransferase